MFDRSSNVQLGGDIMKLYYTKLNLMCGVEHSVSLFFNYVSKLQITNQMIRTHKEIYNLFGYGMYHKLHYIFKSKSY